MLTSIVLFEILSYCRWIAKSKRNDMVEVAAREKAHVFGVSVSVEATI